MFIKVYKTLIKLLHYIEILLLLFFLSSISVTILYKYIKPPVTPLMLIRVVEQFTSGKNVQIKKHWVPLNEISPNLIQSTIAAEDQIYLKHFGFDLIEIQKAFLENKIKKKLFGASTISQQTAKNVFLCLSRTWFRKGIEAYFTVLIEFIWGKKRIMEVYLNVIEMGDGIYGAEMASEIYFHKKAKELTKKEAALLTATFPNPLKCDPTKPTIILINKEYNILQKMKQIKQVEF